MSRKWGIFIFKVRHLKHRHKDYIDTYVENIAVTKKEIYKILLLFNPKEVIIRINGIKNNSEAFKYLVENKIKHINLLYGDDDFFGVTIIFTKVDKNFEELLDAIITNETDYIIISEKNKSITLDSYLYNYQQFESNTAIESNLQTYSLCFDLYEYGIHTTYNKNIYDYKIIKDNITEILKKQGNKK